MILSETGMWLVQENNPWLPQVGWPLGDSHVIMTEGLSPVNLNICYTQLQSWNLGKEKSICHHSGKKHAAIAPSLNYLSFTSSVLES